MTVAIVCEETVTFTIDGAPLCSSGWQTLQYEAVVPFDPSQLDPTMLAVMFAGGFFILVPVWAACVGLKYLMSMLR